MPRQDLLQIARLAYRLAGHVVPPYRSKFSPKKFTQPSLLACLCLKEYLKLDYRGLEALLAGAAELRAALGLRTVPDHSTLHWFARYKVKPRLLVQVLEAAARLFPRRRNGRHVVALDATGFSRSPASRYYVKRLGKSQWHNRFLLLSATVWTKPIVICAQAARLGPGSQSRLLPPLVERTSALLPIAQLLADADYDGEPTHRWLRETRGIESIIPATGCRPGRARGHYRRRMQRYFPHRPYGMRWRAETVFSVIKRKFGEALTARRYWQQVKQAFLRGIVYDCYRAVQLGLLLWRWLYWHLVAVAS